MAHFVGLDVSVKETAVRVQRPSEPGLECGGQQTFSPERRLSAGKPT